MELDFKFVALITQLFAVLAMLMGYGIMAFMFFFAKYTGKTRLKVYGIVAFALSIMLSIYYLGRVGMEFG